jgi:hypothetical protein
VVTAAASAEEPSAVKSRGWPVRPALPKSTSSTASGAASVRAWATVESWKPTRHALTAIRVTSTPAEPRSPPSRVTRSSHSSRTSRGRVAPWYSATSEAVTGPSPAVAPTPSSARDDPGLLASPRLAGFHDTALKPRATAV